LHWGRHWTSSSAVIAEKGLPIFGTGIVEADDVVGFTSFFLGERLFHTSISVTVTVEPVDRPGVELKVDDDDPPE
jgi:hypothetical protein